VATSKPVETLAEQRDRDVAVAFLKGRYQVLGQLLTSPRMHKAQRELIEELAYSTKDKLEQMGVAFGSVETDEEERGA
jgi:hypothetical protein